MAASNQLPFPLVTKQHILNCSYHAWHARYRSLTPKTRLVPLPSAFVEYLRADGIVLPPEHAPAHSSGPDTGTSNDLEASDNEDSDPSQEWPETHASTVSTIQSLGGRVAPKLNWSAPKDATWINPTNSMECRSANDVYMMLKSSDFVTHDLEHAFDGCADGTADAVGVPYYLVLRKWVSAWNPSVEFRCFVRRRKLIGLCQRDLNHYNFLFELRPTIVQLVHQFFKEKLRDSFPDESFVFDVYVPQPYNRVWLVDFNPWAVRTDPILFSWKELLEMEDPFDPVEEINDLSESAEAPEGSFVRLPLRTRSPTLDADSVLRPTMPPTPDESVSSSEDPDDSAHSLLGGRTLELRLIHKSDPEAYTFNTPQYSAHKLPKDVVDASSGGYDAEQLKDFSQKWQELVRTGEMQSNKEEVSDTDGKG